MEDLAKVTRIDVVGKVGSWGTRQFWAEDGWEFHLQDEGRTLKIKAKGPGQEAKRKHLESLAHDLAQAWAVGRQQIHD